ncbi:50S ribosomal protein L23 [Enterobacteriaceae bacterium ET-AT1-13]|nr:50S ribosomal protein L23 [Enterobacteriaceae bacterium ET-AT1-13]WGS66331.1 50S ribosomal protein L23 [Enterobacteriaceae bacterium Cmel17]WMC17354.1 MAG: 50S ribosomal protein L23 [Enterobacteriaceae bacterium Cmel21]WMC17560.1 MAG: 50S ribosomal protein L23 [Enterobacteriaceae bacterium PSmelAO3-2]WMC17765.1 MAG: 50S ribosomal protein L23 [Enterobacteriaceae bacterium PSmelAO3-1]WMC17968.1 MAG: 50S ribosomal protein L23 [Enterobacteriaceae bacterium PSmelAO1]
MIIKNEKLINIIYKIHVSEKVNFIIKNGNSTVLRVIKKFNKNEIKNAVQKIFGIKIKSINTLLVKGKKFRINKNNYGYHKDWKKVYITFKNLK